jgi:putative membrane protein
MKLLLATTMLTFAAMSAVAADDARNHPIDFATKATISNIFEMEAAKIEVAKGKAPEAKKFASDMLRDHSKAGSALADAAQRDGIPVPKDVDTEHRQKLEALSSSDPANMDQAYLSTQLTAHQDAVTLFENYSKGGPDGQLKNTAGKILPDLRMHLTRVQGLTSN